jgi:hypothetical protein
MSLSGSTRLTAKRVQTLLYKEGLTLKGDGARVLVYTLPHVTFKGATVCLGYRLYYSEDAYRGLLSLIPDEFRSVITPVTMSVEEFTSSRNGYYIGGLVFLESDDKGGLYIHDPDTDGRVYLPSLVAYHPMSVYSFEMVPIDQIRVLDELRYRDDYDVDELAENIRRFGLLNPLIIYRDKKAYRLVAGYRRYYALRKLGWPRAPALVLNMPPETQNLVPLIENFFRLQPSKEEYQRLVRYILNSYGGFTSIYDLLRALHIRDKKTVLRLLKETGLETSQDSVHVDHGVEEDTSTEERSLLDLVGRLLEEAEEPVPPQGYDTEAIRMRIEALSSVDDERENGEGDGQVFEPGVHGESELGRDGDDDSVGLVEVPMGLLKRLANYLDAKDADGFKRKLVEFMECLVDSPILLLVAHPDDGHVAYARQVAGLSGGKLVVVEPAKI